MAENLSDSSAEQEGDNLGEEAIWKTGNDPGVPVRVIKRFTTRGGNDFVRLEGVDHPVPAKQIHPIEEPQELFGEPVMWHRPDEEPIEVREVAERDGDNGKEISIQVGGSFEWVPAEQIMRLGEEAIGQVVEVPEIEDASQEASDSEQKEVKEKTGPELKVGDKIVSNTDEENILEIIKIEGEGRHKNLLLHSKLPDGTDKEITVRARDIQQEIEEKTSRLVPAESSSADNEKEPVKVLSIGTKLARRGKPGFVIETITKRPTSGKEYYQIIRRDSEGKVTGRTNEDVDTMQKFLEEGSKWRLEDDSAAEAPESTSEVSHLTPEQQKAQKAIIDYLTPRIKTLKDRVGNPDPGDSLQLAKLEALMQKVQEGKFTEGTQYSGVNKVGENERGSHSVLSYFGRVREFSDEGSAPHRNADNMLAVLREAGIDVDHVDELLAQEDADNGVNPGQNNGNNQRRRNPNRADDSSGDRKVRGRNKERINEKNTWLDPRRIQELKGQYEDALSAYGGPISEAAKNNLKKIIIEREIARAIGAAERVKKLHGVGEVPEVPNDTVKEKMSEMLDLSMQEIGEMAAEKDDLVLEQASQFKKGQEVKIIKHDGSVEDGWKVKGYSYSPNSKPMVSITKGRNMRMIDAETLKQYQETADPDPDKANLEALKSYFGKDVKVKVEDRVIEANFSGISLNGGVYVDIDAGPLLDAEGKPRLDEDGNPRRKYNKVLIKDVNEFLNWQNERLTSEVEEEEKAKRIAEMKAKIDPYIGKEIRAEDAEGNPLEGYKCLEYSEDENKVYIGKPGAGDKYPIDTEQFLKWQEKAEQEKWDKVPPFKKGMKIPLTTPKPDGSTEEVEWTVEDAIEDNGAIHIILKKSDGTKTKMPYAELKQLFDNGGRPIEPPVAPPERAPLPETMSREKEYLTWYERIKKQYNKLDRYEKYGNYYKFMAGFIGVVAMSNLVGLSAGAAIGIQHKRHHARIKAKKEKEIRLKEKEKKTREKQQVAKLPKEHVAG